MPPLHLIHPTEERRPESTQVPRIDALATLPVFLKLEGRRAVVAGGGEPALWKAELLAAAGADVEVFAGENAERFDALSAAPPAGRVTVHRRLYAQADLEGAAIAIAEAGTDEEAARFAAAARRLGVPFNVIDKPELCELQFGAIVNRSPLVVAISTDGAAPVFGQQIRAKIEALLPRGFRRWAKAARDWRPHLRRLELGFAKGRRFWEGFCDRAFAEPAAEPPEGLRDELIREVDATFASLGPKGRVTLVGAGPGDPELLTLKAVRALQSAEVILYDDLVSPEVLEFARREAKRILVGKTGHGRACRQDEINDLMLRLAGQGRHIVRLKGGDPGIFGRASEEIEACRRAGIEVAVVPGITAAQGAAAAAKISLTRRGCTRRLQFVAGYASEGGLPTDLDWGAISDRSALTALYMPRKTLADFRDRAIANGLDPDTPAAAIACATRHDERRIFATISGLPELVSRLDPKGPLLVLIGRGIESEAASEPRRAADAPQRSFAAGGRFRKDPTPALWG